MRLAIINLTGGGLSGGGIKTMRYLVPSLLDDAGVNSVRVFVPSKIADMPLFDNQDVRAWPDWDWIKGRPWLKREIRAFAPDVIYVPNAAWLNFGSVPSVIMVRNMEALVQPFGGNPLSTCIKNVLRREMARYACRNATRIIAISEFVRDFLVNKWNVPSRKIEVIHHGIEPPLPPEKSKKPYLPDKIDSGQFIFTARSLVHYRGLEDIIQAISILKKRYPSCRLLIGGESCHGTSGYKKRIKQLADKLGVASHIIWAGHLSHAEMSWCFHNCDAFVMTSRLEACPNIALEALSHGCINISTSQPPMPEIFSNSALYYNAGQPEDLVKCIIRTMSLTPADKTAMRDSARHTSKQFSWAITARKTFKNLEEAICSREDKV